MDFKNRKWKKNVGISMTGLQWWALCDKLSKALHKDSFKADAFREIYGIIKHIKGVLKQEGLILEQPIKHNKEVKE